MEFIECLHCIFKHTETHTHFYTRSCIEISTRFSQKFIAPIVNENVNGQPVSKARKRRDKSSSVFEHDRIELASDSLFSSPLFRAALAPRNNVSRLKLQPVLRHRRSDLAERPHFMDTCSSSLRLECCIDLR